jgi:hypothetical protein
VILGEFDPRETLQASHWAPACAGATAFHKLV